MCFCEVFDNGVFGFIDVYEFEVVDLDYFFGVEWIFDLVDGVLRFVWDVLRMS